MNLNLPKTLINITTNNLTFTEIKCLIAAHQLNNTNSTPYYIPCIKCYSLQNDIYKRVPNDYMKYIIPFFNYYAAELESYQIYQKYNNNNDFFLYIIELYHVTSQLNYPYIDSDTKKIVADLYDYVRTLQDINKNGATAKLLLEKIIEMFHHVSIISN